MLMMKKLFHISISNKGFYKFDKDIQKNRLMEIFLTKSVLSEKTERIKFFKVFKYKRNIAVNYK